jgi:hypothetical protein
VLSRGGHSVLFTMIDIDSSIVFNSWFDIDKSIVIRIPRFDNR